MRKDLRLVRPEKWSGRKSGGEVKKLARYLVPGQPPIYYHKVWPSFRSLMPQQLSKATKKQLDFKTFYQWLAPAEARLNRGPAFSECPLKMPTSLLMKMPICIFYLNKKLLLNIYNLFTTSHIWISSTMILIQIMLCFRSQLIELK